VPSDQRRCYLAQDLHNRGRRRGSERKKEPIVMTTTTTSTDDLANIPHPPGATRVHEWFNDDQPRAP